MERERDGGGNPKSDHVDKICQFVQTDLQKEAAKNEIRKQGGSIKLCQAKTGEAGKKQERERIKGRKQLKGKRRTGRKGEGNPDVGTGPTLLDWIKLNRKADSSEDNDKGQLG